MNEEWKHNHQDHQATYTDAAGRTSDRSRLVLVSPSRVIKAHGAAGPFHEVILEVEKAWS